MFDFMTKSFLVLSKEKMAAEETILELLKSQSKAMSAGQIAEVTGIERKEVDKAMKKLKTDGSIVSPKRCYWTAG